LDATRRTGAGSAVAQEKKEMTVQQQRMQSCNADAKKQTFKDNDARQAYMSSCLKGEKPAEAASMTPQQQRMKSCNADAAKQGIGFGAGKKDFMNEDAIAEINKAGVKVRYMLYPRTGPGSESWKKAEQVWCAADRKEALTRAKRGEEVKSKDCKSAQVASDYQFGDQLGVEGTPAVFTQGGVYIGGFMTPDQLVQAIRDAGA